MGYKMLIFNNEFFLKFRRLLHIVIFCLLVVMVFVKYKMYNLKNEVRAIENKIIELSSNKDSLLTELAYLSNPERLNNIYVSLINKYGVAEKNIASYKNIKSLENIEKYYAEKNKDNDKKTDMVSTR